MFHTYEQEKEENGVLFFPVMVHVTFVDGGECIHLVFGLKEAGLGQDNAA